MVKYDDRPKAVNFQGFIILEDRRSTWTESQLTAYFSKFIGKTVKLHCLPEEPEMEKAAEELFPFCWRVVLITRPYIIRHSANDLIRKIKEKYPRLEHTKMQYT